MLSAIQKRIPPKEQLYFGCCVIVAVVIVLLMPMSAPALEELRDNAITKSAGGIAPEKLRKELLPLAQQPPQMGDAARLDDVKVRIERRIRTTPAADSREVFMRLSEKSYPLPLVTADALPGVPAIPGYDVPVGEAPAVRLQQRFVPPAKEPVDLSNKERDNPNGFEDR